MKKLITKDVIGFEGLYTISSNGTIIRLARKRKEGWKDLPARRLSIGGTVGYPTANFYKDGKKFAFTMHRLMAIHFIPNSDPENKKHVNHKNRKTWDFRLKNLEWSTISDNVKHGKQPQKDFKFPPGYVEKLLEDMAKGKKKK